MELRFETVGVEADDAPHRSMAVDDEQLAADPQPLLGKPGAGEREGVPVFAECRQVVRFLVVTVQIMRRRAWRRQTT